MSVAYSEAVRPFGRRVGGEEIPYSSYTTKGDSFPLTFQLLLLLLRSLLSFPVGSDSINFFFPVSLSSVSPGRGFAKGERRPLPYMKPTTMYDKNVTHIALFGDSQSVSRGGG